MTHVAPRIVNNVSFVSRINHEIHFSWQAQYREAPMVSMGQRFS